MAGYWWGMADCHKIGVGTSFLVAESRKIIGGIDSGLVLCWSNLWPLLLLGLQVFLPSWAGDFKEIMDVLEPFFSRVLQLPLSRP